MIQTIWTCTAASSHPFMCLNGRVNYARPRSSSFLFTHSFFDWWDAEVATKSTKTACNNESWTWNLRLGQKIPKRSKMSILCPFVWKAVGFLSLHLSPWPVTLCASAVLLAPLAPKASAPFTATSSRSKTNRDSPACRDVGVDSHGPSTFVRHSRHSSFSCQTSQG